MLDFVQFFSWLHTQHFKFVRHVHKVNIISSTPKSGFFTILMENMILAMILLLPAPKIGPGTVSDTVPGSVFFRTFFIKKYKNNQK